jgi:hypothetical protein
MTASSNKKAIISDMDRELGLLTCRDIGFALNNLGYNIIETTSKWDELKKKISNSEGVDLVIVDIDFREKEIQTVLDEIYKHSPLAHIFFTATYPGTEGIIKKMGLHYISKPYIGEIESVISKQLPEFGGYANKPFVSENNI